MRKSVFAIIAAAGIILSAGCSEEKQYEFAEGSSRTASTTASAAETTAATTAVTTTTAAKTDNPIMTMPADVIEDENPDDDNNGLFNEEGKIDLRGYMLDDAIDILEALGIDDTYVDYEQENGGGPIMVKNNFVVTDQRVENKKVILLCSRERYWGIGDSVKEAFGDLMDGVDEIKAAAKDIGEILDSLNLG